MRLRRLLEEGGDVRALPDFIIFVIESTRMCADIKLSLIVDHV